MKPVWVAGWLLAGWLLTGSGGAVLKAGTLEEIMAKVQTNTGQFEKSLPDFVCDERVVSGFTSQGKQKEVVIESRFVGLQKRSARSTFTEAREVGTVDGKRAKPGQKFDGPFLFGGGFSSILALTFGEKAIPNHIYQLAGEEVFGGRKALVIDFRTRDDQKELFFSLRGKTVLNKDVGRAWIDQETSHVLRIERTYLRVYEGESSIVTTVDYGEVQIGGSPFWMPKSVRAVQAVSRRGARGEYRAEYRNYRKFDISTSISFDEK